MLGILKVEQVDGRALALGLGAALALALALERADVLPVVLPPRQAASSNAHPTKRDFSGLAIPMSPSCRATDQELRAASARRGVAAKL